MRPIALLASTALTVMLAAACEPNPPRMRTTSMTRVGDELVVTFDVPLENRSTNQYWIALQRADAPTSSTEGRVVLERGDRMIVLHATRPGDYEIRLHDRYPKKESHLVERIPITILYRADWQSTGPAID